MYFYSADCEGKWWKEISAAVLKRLLSEVARWMRMPGGSTSAHRWESSTRPPN